MTKTYKWEKLKKDAISNFLAKSDRFRSFTMGADRDMAIAAILENNLVDKSAYDKPNRDWKPIFDRLREDVVKVIDKWDVSCVVTLIEKFPNIVSQKHLGKTPTIEMENNGNWVVIFD